MSTPTVNPTRQQLDELDALLQRMLSLPLNQLDGDLGTVPPPPPPPVRPPLPPVGYSTNPAPLPQTQPSRPMAPPPRPVASAPRPAPPPMPPRKEPSPGDHTWNVPLPPSGGVSVYGTWPMGIEAIAPSSRPVVPPPAPPSNLRVTTIPSPDETNEAREAVPPLDRFRMEAPAPYVPVPPPPAATRPVPPPSEPVPALLWPLAAIDWTVGKPLSIFGAPGRWLGQGGGKTLVGWGGMFLLAAAVIWGVVDYMGWAW